MASSNAYADPYNNDPNYTYHNSYPTTPQDENPYAHDAEPQYNASNDYTSQPYASTDKMVEPPAEYAGTERVRKGRTGAEGAAKSWGTTGPPPRSTGILRMWRKDERGKQWTRGGGCRVFLRMFCCCFSIGITVAISIILAILLYVRPPSVLLNDLTVGNNPVTISTTGLSISLAVSLNVSNPNWFSVNFEQIKATVTYPGVDSGSLGGGTLNNANFAGYTSTKFDFPLSFK